MVKNDQDMPKDHELDKNITLVIIINGLNCWISKRYIYSVFSVLQSLGNVIWTEILGSGLGVSSWRGRSKPTFGFRLGSTSSFLIVVLFCLLIFFFLLFLIGNSKHLQNEYAEISYNHIQHLVHDYCFVSDVIFSF